jgi:hypothetical protein
MPTWIKPTVSKLAIIFLGCFVYGIYSLIIVGPVYGFYLYELVYFLNPGNRWWSASLPNLSYSFVVVLLMLVMFFIKRKEHVLNTIQTMPQAKWFILVFITYFIVGFFAISHEIHQRYLFDLFKLYIVMFVAYRVLDTNKKLETALFIYLIGAAYIGYEAFSVGRNSLGRVEGIGMVDVPEANGTAAALVPAIPILVYFFWSKPWKTKLFVSVLGVFIANGLVLINSRGAFLGAAVGFGYFLMYMFFSKYKLPKQRMMIIFLIMASFAGVIRIADDAFWERMNTIKGSSITSTESSGGRRMNFWVATFDMLEDHPFGLGIYGYQILSPLYLDESLLDSHFRSTNMRAVHSMWFQGLAEIGWLGALFFLFLLKSIFKQLKQAKKKLVNSKLYKNYYFLISLEAGLIGYMVAGSFINAFRTEIFYWMIIFCIIGSSIVMHRENTDEPVKKGEGGE